MGLSAVISQGASVMFCWRLWLTTSYFSDYGCIYFSVHLLYTMTIKLVLPTNEAVGEAVLWRISLCKFLPALSNCSTFCQKDRVGVQNCFCPFTLKLQILAFCQFDIKFFLKFGPHNIPFVHTVYFAQFQKWVSQPKATEPINFVWSWVLGSYFLLTTKWCHFCPISFLQFWLLKYFLLILHRMESCERDVQHWASVLFIHYMGGARQLEVMFEVMKAMKLKWKIVWEKKEHQAKALLKHHS